MKTIKKLMILVISAITIFLMGTSVFAVNSKSANNNDLRIQITTNKSSYSATGVANFTVTVTNTGSKDLKKVSAEAVFSDLAPAGKKNSQTAKETDILKAGESLSFSYKATLNKNAHKLNFFQKIILWFVRLFNGGYNVGNNGFDNGRECVTETNMVPFGKFSAKNTVKVWYEKGTGNDSSKPTYEELIENVDIDEMYPDDESHYVIDNETGIEFIDNIIVIEFEEDCSKKQRAKIINSINGKVVGGDETYDELYVEIKKSTLEELENICNDLENMDGVDLAYYEELNNLTVNYIPTDPFKDNESDKVDWNGTNINTGLNNWWVLATELTGAWEYDNYFNNINIGIADTGFDTSHEDLKLNLVSEEKSAENHGTHVAGIIGATHNDKGIAGIVRKKSIYAYDLAKSNGAFKTTTEALKALKILVEDYECKVINFSIGINVYEENGNLYKDEKCKKEIKNDDITDWGYRASKKIGKLLQKGYDFVVVQSAGNGTKNGGVYCGIDAIYNGNFCSITRENCYSNDFVSKDNIMNRVIIVANSKKENQNYIMDDSSNGDYQVNIAAPGANIFSTVAGIEKKEGNITIISAGQKYGHLTGTSMAAPIVTGVASLVWSVNSKFSGEQVKKIVIDTAEKGNIIVSSNPNVHNTTGGFYLVNAKLAVEEAIKQTYGMGSIAGNVKERDTEKPLENILIKATKGDKTLTTLTDENGQFKLSLPVGKWTISLSSSTHYTNSTNTINVEKDIDTVIFNPFYMTRMPSRITGTVKDKKTDLPISGVKVEFIENGVSGLEPVATVITGKDGKYSINLPYASYSISFNHDNYEYYGKSLTVSYENYEVNASLSPKKGSGSEGEGDDGHESVKVEFAGGEGTEENPYQVATPEQLNEIRNHLDSHFVQTGDIDLSAYGNWEPIGNLENAFSGTYDGNGFSISNFKYSLQDSNNKENVYVGLFGYSKGIFKNINLYDVTIRIHLSTLNQGEFYIGSLIGAQITPDGKVGINNCSVSCEIDVNSYHGHIVTIGGVAGYLRGNNKNKKDSILIKNCFSYGKINNISNYRPWSSSIHTVSGGIVGKIESYSTSYNGKYFDYIVENCKNNIEITGSIAGGISGYVYNHAKIVSCENFSDVEGIYYSGGIIAFSSARSVENCKNYGNISTNNFSDEKCSYGKAFSGGIIGDGGKYVANCKNYGTISSTLISETNNQHEFDASPEVFSGGIIGNGFVNIYNCVNYGDVISNVSLSTTKGGASYPSNYCGLSSGGIIGLSEGSGYNCRLIISKCANFSKEISSKLYIDAPEHYGYVSNSSGGIVGYAFSDYILIEDCYNIANCKTITSTMDSDKMLDSNYCGGIAGRIYGFGHTPVCNSSYSLGMISSVGAKKNHNFFGSLIGEIVGRDTGTVSVNYCYYLIENGFPCNNTLLNGCIGLLNNEFKKKDSFVGFDFETIWNINNNYNNGFPYLR